MVDTEQNNKSSVVVLSVIMLNVVAPTLHLKREYKMDILNPISADVLVHLYRPWR